AALPTPPILPPGLAECSGLALPAGLNLVNEACDGLSTPAAFVFDPSCPRGQACKRTETDGRLTFSANDRTVAYIDPGGNVYMASEDGSHAASISRLGSAEQPAWSPDGRYLAYVLFQPVNAG